MTFEITRARLEAFKVSSCRGDPASLETVASASTILDLVEAAGFRAPLIGLGLGGEVSMSWDGVGGSIVALDCHGSGNYIAVAISGAGAVLASGAYRPSELPDWLRQLLAP